MADLENTLRRDLFTIAANWALLLDLPRVTVARINGRVEAPLPVPVGVLSFRRESGEQLGAWAHLVHDERDLHTSLDLMDVVAVARFLDHHADYLAHHEAGRDACDEIGTIAAKVVEYVAQTKGRRVVVGHCPDCEGVLVAYLRPKDALLPNEVRCSNGVHSWSPWEWSRLGERLRRWDEDAAARLVAALIRPSM